MMPGPVLTADTVLTCSYSAPVSPVTTNTRVLVAGTPVLVLTDAFPVAGCPFQVLVGTGTKPQPCVRVQWRSCGDLLNGRGRGLCRVPTPQTRPHLASQS